LQTWISHRIVAKSAKRVLKSAKRVLKSAKRVLKSAKSTSKQAELDIFSPQNMIVLEKMLTFAGCKGLIATKIK